MSRTRVAILRGGPSDEYSVSLKTGGAVLDAIDTTRFEPLDIIVTKDGEWLHNGIARYPEHILPTIDIAFIALHGAYGEDGTIQRILERFGVPYTGSNPYASRIAMHKGYTKDVLRNAHIPGIQFAPHILVTRESIDTLNRIGAHIIEAFGPEYIVKPTTSGSSLGAIHVASPLDLHDAMKELLTMYPEILVEQYIRGREATCGVVERYRNRETYVFPIVEIIPPSTSTFYDAENRYSENTALVCPARFDTNTKNHIEQASKTIHSTIGLSQYSRSDFIVAPDGVYFLEVNALPGLTHQSLLPKAFDAVGENHKGFITHILSDALAHKIPMHSVTI